MMSATGKAALSGVPECIKAAENEMMQITIDTSSKLENLRTGTDRNNQSELVI